MHWPLGQEQQGRTTHIATSDFRAAAPPPWPIAMPTTPTRATTPTGFPWETTRATTPATPTRAKTSRRATTATMRPFTKKPPLAAMFAMPLPTAMPMMITRFVFATAMLMMITRFVFATAMPMRPDAPAGLLYRIAIPTTPAHSICPSTRWVIAN
jgi:hypothetical protein